MLPLKTQVTGRRLSRGCHRCKLEIELADTCSMYMQLCSHPGCGPSAQHPEIHMRTRGAETGQAERAPLHAKQRVLHPCSTNTTGKDRLPMPPAPPKSQGGASAHTQVATNGSLYEQAPPQESMLCTLQRHLQPNNAKPDTHQGTLCQTLHVCK